MLNHRADWLLNGGSGSGAGPVTLDTRACPPYGFLQYATPGASAVFKLQASIDPATSGWNDLGTYTATNTTGTAQLSGYYPYVRAVANSIYSGGGATGLPFAYVAMGIK